MMFQIFNEKLTFYKTVMQDRLTLQSENNPEVLFLTFNHYFINPLTIMSAGDSYISKRENSSFCFSSKVADTQSNFTQSELDLQKPFFHTMKHWRNLSCLMLRCWINLSPQMKSATSFFDSISASCFFYTCFIDSLFRIVD